MFHQLVSHNGDLQALVKKGYAIAFDSTNHLVVRDIPYLDEHGELRWGAFVVQLEFVDKVKVLQRDHSVFFAGSVPYGLNKLPIPNLAGGPCTVALSEASADVIVQRSFSNRPPSGKFENFFEKIESYSAIIAGPAIERFKANPHTFRAMEKVADDSVFKFRDTLTSLSETTDLAMKFKDDVIAIIGLGGTGSFVLDFIAKTPVREIRVFDGDDFRTHNAFRSPGRTEEAEFGQKKATVFAARYESLRVGVSGVASRVHAASTGLDGVTFAFVCVDNGPSRAGVFERLLSLHVPFIDVGMGLARQQSGIDGLLRATYFSAEDGQSTRDKQLADLAGTDDDIYRTNIQIGELNALNAALAVLRFKQLRGFYVQEIAYEHLVFGVGDQKTAGLEIDT